MDYRYAPSLPTWEQLSPYVDDELLEQLIHVAGTPMTDIQRKFWSWVRAQDWTKR